MAGYVFLTYRDEPMTDDPEISPFVRQADTCRLANVHDPSRANLYRRADLFDCEDMLERQLSETERAQLCAGDRVLATTTTSAP